jgi:hypothetical protein
MSSEKMYINGIIDDLKIIKAKNPKGLKDQRKAWAVENMKKLIELWGYNKKLYLPNEDEIMDSLAERITQCGDSNG